VLTHHLGLDLDASSVIAQTTSTSPPYTVTWGTRPAALPATATAISSSFIGYTTFNLPTSAWWGGPYAGTSSSANCDFYLHICAENCHAKVTVFGIYTSGGQTGDAFGDAATIDLYTKTTCVPFVYTDASFSGPNNILTGTHGSDDLTPVGSTGFGSLGNYTTS
jgi:hypothetical protein